MSRKHILLVEDDSDVRPLLEHILLGEGYRVAVAETMAQATSLLETKVYDLVLTDGVLPDGSGIAIADKARARGIKALIITGHALQNSKEDLERHEYLLKPVRAHELLAAVARQLNPRPLLTVLFAEDDGALRDVVIRALSEKGFGVLTAINGFEALRILQSRPVDLLFADILMPGMDGVELAERAKRLRPGLKVLFATGYPLTAASRNATSHGRVLYKPLRTVEMLQEVEAALGA